MRFVYFIQTHKNLEQVYRLVRTIRRMSPVSLIIVGHDENQCSFDPSAIQDVPNVICLRNKFRITYPRLSVLKPYLRAIDHLIQKKIPFDWLFYISGQHYPVRHLAQVESEIAGSGYDGILSFVRCETCWGVKETFRRYYRRYWTLPVWAGEIYEMIRCFCLRTGLKERWSLVFMEDSFSIGRPFQDPAKIPFTESYPCYGGHNWAILSKNCVIYFKDYLRDHPKLWNYYQRILHPDESIIQTVLVNSGLFNLCNHGKLFVQWIKGSSPRILTTTDLPAMLNGKYYFARKFDITTDSQVLDMIDEELFRIPS